MNQDKKEVFIHKLADVQSSNIGSQTRIWQFSIILEDAIIGRNCNICSHTFIENKVIIGDNVTVKCGVYLYDGMIIKDNVFIGSNATFINDKYPKSKQYKIPQETILNKNVSIGANSTILGGIRIGENSFIGAGSVITKDVPDNEYWLGNPARFLKKCNMVVRELDNNS